MVFLKTLKTELFKLHKRCMNFNFFFQENIIPNRMVSKTKQGKKKLIRAQVEKHVMDKM